ncbi:hypothetical protein QMK17_03960 [Rhodococcus sp. G-MC3]|uniref:hypothetical protein n=1 Tax=Rhodococcus sp. G-MC3 TaxID=3046209 RepID=UPI0024B93349|nr:hypothetical protein [Rhodococcus sp. G-MC3]MDJ0392488.1 hypothetical protein [Rhodococcus sp. G-MC3]
MLKLAGALSSEHEVGSLFITATVEMVQCDSDVAGTAYAAYEALRETYRRCIGDAQESSEVARESTRDRWPPSSLQ